jgi:DNA-binding transcriptional regulator YhcF (GntR family)
MDTVEQSAKSPNPFVVDSDDELPVGLQLTLRMRALIATGRLPAGDRLPSVRRLAEWAGVNLGTVRAVYAGLEAAGLIVSQQGRGTFVAADVRTAPELPSEAAGAADPSALAGIDTSEVEAIGVRRELRRQIGVLERELAGYARDIPTDLPTAPRITSAHVAGVEELEQTRDTLVAQLSEARRAAERRAAVEARRQAGSEPAPGAEEAGPLARAMGWWRQKR